MQMARRGAERCSLSRNIFSMEHEFASIEEGVEFISDRIRSMKSIPKELREELLAQAVGLSDPEPLYALPDFSSG